jgi:hypothetical protein
MNTARIKWLTQAAGVAIFVVIFVGLGVSNFALRRRLDIAEQRLRIRADAAPAAYRVGEIVPSFHAVDRNGRIATLGGATPHGWVLVVVHPKCKYCRALVRTLSERTAQSAGALRDAQRLAIVSLAPATRSAELTAGAPPTVPLYYLDRGTSLPGYAHINVVPQIIQIGANGRVAKICRTIDQCTGGVRADCVNCSS